MKILALELVGEFSKVQESVDALVTMYFDRRTPGMAKYLKQRRVTTNISDADRPSLVLNIAADLGITEDLSSFRPVYDRVKTVRDYAGHSARVQAVDPDTLQLTKRYFHGLGGKEEPPMTITRDDMVARLRDARWLAHYVHYLMVSGGLIKQAFLGSREIQVIAPSKDPDGWDESMFRFIPE